MYRWTQNKENNKNKNSTTCDKIDDLPKNGQSDRLTTGHDVSPTSDLSTNGYLNDNFSTINDAKNPKSGSDDLSNCGAKSDLFDLLDHQEKFDLILCADCLFFDDGRRDLVVAIYKLLK